jgi:hypothetical protein
MPYFYGLAGGAADWPAWATQPGEVFVARYAAEGVSWEAAGRLGDETTAGAALARFGDGAIGLQAAEARRVPGGVEVNLAWRVHRPPADQVTAFVHVLDGDGRLLGQADGDPLGGNFPFAQWPPGTAAIDRRFVPAGDAAARVLVGLYDRLTGERLAAAAGGVALGEDAFALPVP